MDSWRSDWEGGGSQDVWCGQHEANEPLCELPSLDHVRTEGKL